VLSFTFSFSYVQNTLQWQILSIKRQSIT
jgi:hypothetical protein